MPLIIYILVLGFLLLLLYLFGQRIIQTFSLISLLLFDTNKFGIYFYFLFFLPGVILHELAHFFMAIILGVPTGQISIFPERKDQKTDRGQDWTLGQVNSAESDPLRNSLIGLAPMIVGVLSLILLVQSGLQIQLPLNLSRLSFSGWQTVFYLYLILVFANTMFLSKEDSKGVWALPVLMIIFFLLARALGFISFLSEKGIFNGLEMGLNEVAMSLILSFSLTVLVDFVFLLPLILLTQVLLKIRK